MQDVTSERGINRQAFIPKTDKQLYAKYDLSESEIAFIDEKIAPME